MDRGGWWATGLEITKSWKQLSSQATSCITHCDKWNDGNHGGSQASELTCQRVGRLQSLSDDVWARTESVRAPSFQTGPDSRRLALWPASGHSIGHCAGLVRHHLPPRCAASHTASLPSYLRPRFSQLCPWRILGITTNCLQAPDTHTPPRQLEHVYQYIRLNSFLNPIAPTHRSASHSLFVSIFWKWRSWLRVYLKSWQKFLNCFT